MLIHARPSIARSALPVCRTCSPLRIMLGLAARGRISGRNDDGKTIRGRWIGLVAAIVVMGPLLVSTKGRRGSSSTAGPGCRSRHSYEIREVSINARVRDQVAEVQVSQTFHNPGSFQLETEFLFPLPEDGAIQNFVLMVDGRELPGRLLPKDEARRIYEDIVRSKRDPALLEYMGRGLYRTSVFPIPPGADRKVTMRYTQLCKRDRDVVEFSYPLSTQKFTSKPIQRLVVRSRSRARKRSNRCIVPATMSGSTDPATTTSASASSARTLCRAMISGSSIPSLTASCRRRSSASGPASPRTAISWSSPAPR